MLYLDSFTFPDSDDEFQFFMSVKRNCYTSFYPFQILSQKELRILNFEPITILYGGNGSGKSTILNIIAEKLNLKRSAPFNCSSFYMEYLTLCDFSLCRTLPKYHSIITSDDVFDYMLNIRMLNEKIDTKRENLFHDFLDYKFADFKYHSLKDYEKLKKVNESRRKTQSKFVRDNLMDNIREFSNGENAYRYFSEQINESGLYLLDEPENSLSPMRQMQLLDLLTDYSLHHDCQFLISTHSPFLLSCPDAKIYDLDHIPVKKQKWTELENVRLYYDFFCKHKHEFE